MRRWLVGVLLLVWTSALSGAHAQAQTRDEQQLHTWDDALLLDLAVGFVPVANDVPLIVGVGVRIAAIHELFARTGYMAVGDDAGLAFAQLGYRAVLRPHAVVRPVIGGYLVALPATCTHTGCTPDAFFVIAATGGVRLEPVPWLGVFALLSLGIDSYPNPFGMVELGMTWALPLS